MQRPTSPIGVPACGPLPTLAKIRLPRSERRGGRYPAGAHGVAVGAVRRLHCDARPGVARHNSLRSLRELRSNKCRESVYEARCARRPRACASRRPTNRPRRAPPAARASAVFFDARKTNTASAKGCAGGSRRACGAPRSAGLVAARACAPRNQTRRMCLSGASAARAASYATGHEPEHRREACAKRRPPHLSAAARPRTPLPRRPSDGISKVAKDWRLQACARTSAMGRKPASRSDRSDVSFQRASKGLKGNNRSRSRGAGAAAAASRAPGCAADRG
jgi:hypothetical protein